jgi:hypothetical protein
MSHLPNLPAFELVFTAGDRLPDLTGVLDATDITGHIIVLSLTRPAPHGLLTKNATITNGPAGTFLFSWATGDLVGGFGQAALVRMTTPGGLVETLARFTLDVALAP